MEFTDYERYRGILAGLFIDLTKTRDAMSALGQALGTNTPDTVPERSRLFNAMVTLEREVTATLNGARALLSPEELDRIEIEARTIADETLADPSAGSSIARAIVYSNGPPDRGVLQHVRTTPDGQVEWEIEAKYPRRTIASGIALTLSEASAALEHALAAYEGE